jgi:tellurite methyltransferase
VDTYAALRAGSEANPFVIDALSHLPMDGGRRALDIGAGPLNDTRFLLGASFSVDAVDRDPLAARLAGEIDDRRLDFVQADICDFDIAPGTYALIVAIHALPFLERDDLFRLVPRLVDGLAKDGVLCCTMFGREDGWAACRPRMTFLSRPEVEALFRPLEPLSIAEMRYDGVTANSRAKHWHVMRCIFRRRATVSCLEFLSRSKLGNDNG